MQMFKTLNVPNMTALRQRLEFSLFLDLFGRPFVPNFDIGISDLFKADLAQ
jgi:hypothetical protein